MKNLVTGIFNCFLLLGCSNPTSAIKNNETEKTKVATSDSSEKLALHYLFDKIKKVPNARLEENKIKIGDTSIQVKINVEFEGQKEGKWIYAANIFTFYKANKEELINVGSIGIGSTKEEALNVCIQEWVAIFGIPFTNMLNDKESIKVSNLKVFPGLMGTRGNPPAKTWLKGYDEMTNKMISKIQQEIKSKPGNLVSVDIKLMIGKSGVTDGECRIDNEVSQNLLNDLKQLDWPPSDEEFILKQFYLIRKGND